MVNDLVLAQRLKLTVVNANHEKRRFGPYRLLKDKTYVIFLTRTKLRNRSFNEIH